MKKSILTILGLALLAACSQVPEQEVTLIESPANGNSSLARLLTDPSGDIYLSWVEKFESKTTKLFYSKLGNNAWDTPNQISEGKDWFVNWADFPSLLVNGDQMAAHWLQKSDQGTYDYDIRMVQSSNRGATWGESIVVHNDGVAAEHGFVSMLPMDNKDIFITWLDGRNTKGSDHESGEHGGEGAMTLRGAIFDAQGNAKARWELDNRICDCCQTSAAMTSNGPVVVYRDRSETEIRDMSIVRYVNGKWTPPQAVAVELWEIPGCPVNGPAISAIGNNVATAWFTAKGGTPQVKMAFSNDGGANFGKPIMISEGATNGRVGISHLENGTVVVSWMDTKDEVAHIIVANYDNRGTLLKKVEVAQTSAARASGFPVITTSGNKVYMAWTEVAEQTIVKTAKINL